ncbi:hypothetical protein CF319_g7898 [Tilletia indica]|nr:hypothetical protein CF319_g7898 [Tilletia indica]
MINIHSTSLLIILSTLLASIALAAPSSHSHLPSAAHTKALHTRTGHPSLNVTKSIPYAEILNKYIASKGHGKEVCPTLYPRAEWRALTDEQRQKWIKATWCMTTKPSLLAGTETNLDGMKTSLLDDFTLLHVRLFYKTHYVSQFLPWHRWLVHARDMAMRDCGFEGPFPYWDWSIDADIGDVQKSPILTNTFGLGGNGSSPDGIVTTGPFAYLPASYRNMNEKNESSTEYSPAYLTRAFGVSNAANPQFPPFHEADNSTAVRKALSVDGFRSNNFSAFATALEGMRRDFEVVNPGLHGGVHRAIGGTMMHSHSSNDPVFWLHHANLDRLWWYWQNGDTTGRGLPSHTVNTSDLNGRFWSYSGHTVQYDLDPTGGPEASLFDVQTLEGLYLPNIETYKLMDTTRPPLCYKYT